MQEPIGSSRHDLPPGGDFGLVMPAASTEASLLHVEDPASIAGDREAFHHAMKSLGDKITDYLAVLQNPEQPPSNPHAKATPRNKLTVYCEGRATIDEVALLFVEALPNLAATCHPLVVSTLRDGTLRRCRQTNTRAQALDEHWVQGQKYRVPLEAVVQSRLGWCPMPDVHRPG